MSKREQSTPIEKCEEFLNLVYWFHSFFNEEKLPFETAFKFYAGNFENRCSIGNMANECGMGIYSVRDHLYDELSKLYVEDEG